MGEAPVRKKNVHRIILITANVIIVMAIFTVLLTYVQHASANRQNQNREQFEAVTDSVAQTILGRLQSYQEMVESVAAYINAGDMTMEEAIAYARLVNTDENHMYHIVRTDDMTGLSTRASKLDATDYTVDYSKLASSRIESKTMVQAMSILYDENSDKTIHATRAYNNPTDAKSVVAFYAKVWLTEDGVPEEAMLMLLADVEDLRSEYRFPEGIFAATGTAIIDSDSGDYVISTPELKNSSFFEYLLQYNDINYQDLNELKSQIATGKTVSQTYYNYKGEKVRYIISSVEGADGWTLVSFLPVNVLNQLTADNIWMIASILIVLVVVLLVIDMVYFTKLNTSLEKANRAKTDFLSTMSHDIRTPLNAIIGLTTLTEKHTEDSAVVADNLRKIKQSGQHLLTLINDILDISKIESGRMNVTITPFSLQESREYLIDMCMTQAEEKGLTLTIDEDIPSKQKLLGDKLRLYQVMLNILSNAIKYTNSGGKVHVLISERIIKNSEAEVEYVVTDTGIGMSGKFMEHMYENFAREKDGRIDKIQGTGLGLSIVKKIVDYMEGTITCQSKVNEGTEFRVVLRFPLDEGTLNTECCDAQPQEITGLKILVAEDNDLNWEIINEMLEIRGISSKRAQNGLEAVQMLEAGKEQFSLVLMDIQMPVMNGLEATKRIRSSETETVRNIPIIALTADAFAENVEECLQCGINAHVAKPVNMDLLMRAINKVLKKEKDK